MNPNPHLDYLRLSDIQEARYRRGVPPTEDDCQWFQRNRKSRDGWPRRYRVRPSVVTDHPAFGAGMVEHANYITIIVRSDWSRLVIAKAEDKFGPVVNADEYAVLRIDEEIEEEKRRNALAPKSMESGYQWEQPT